MLVLALDTATPAVTAGIVELTHDRIVPRAQRVAHDPRKHAELLMPQVLAAAAAAGVRLTDLAAVVVGTGPGPFTGLRVGMVTAAALGDALGLPVHGVCSLDAIAAEVAAAAAPAALPAALPAATPAGEPVPERTGRRPVVVTDARRREVYWAAYDESGQRVEGPRVSSPAALLERLPELAVTVAAGACAQVCGLPVVPPTAPGPAGLVAVAAPALRAGRTPAPLEPLYLRRPDAVEPGPRKPVGVG